MPLTAPHDALSGRRAAAEVAFELACIFATLWVLTSSSPPWLRVGVAGMCVVFPAWCIVRGQTRFPELAWKGTAFAAAAVPVFWYTVASTAVLLGLRFASQQFHYDLAADDNWAPRLVTYLGWAFVQQAGLQTFLTRRMQAIFISPWLVSGATALTFALIHFPNPVLVPLTFAAGAFWSWSFQRAPNLYALALSHAWLAIAARYCLPVAWTHGLRIGPGYWQY